MRVATLGNRASSFLTREDLRPRYRREAYPELDASQIGPVFESYTRWRAMRQRVVEVAELVQPLDAPAAPGT